MKKQISFYRSAFLIFLFITGSAGYSQNVGINSTGATPNISALLDVDAAPTNDKGILIPRVGLTVTTSNAPIGASVATSLLVYNTATLNDVTPGYYYWDGTKWVRLLGNNNAWLLLGNAGTTAGTNFLGTTDAQDMVFKTNNTEWMRILTNGFVGIGTTTPDAELEVISTQGGMPRGTLITQYNSGVLSDAQLWMRKARGTETSPLAVQANDEIGFIKFRGYNGSAFSTNDQTEMGALATEGWTPAANGGCLKFMTTANGTTTGLERMRIDHTGNVGIGTSTPVTNLEVWANDFQTAINIVNASSTVARNPRLNIYDYGSGGSGVMQFNVARGTSTAPLPVITGDCIGKMECAGWQGTSFPDGVQLRAYATENWSAAGAGAQFIVRTVPNGTVGLPFDRFTVDHNGNVGIGTTSPQTSLHIITENVTTNPRCLLVQYAANNNNSAFMVLRKNRGTYLAPLAVQNGDQLGTVLSEAFDGAAYIRTGASMKFSSNGAVAVGSVPTDIYFTTGSSGLGTEVMRLTSGGFVGIGTGAPVSVLEVIENGAASTRGIVSTQYNASTIGARLILRKARGTSASPTAALSGDNAGLVVYSSFDGATFVDGATVESKASQNWAPGTTGANIIFTTTANGTTGRIQRMILDDVGNLGIGTAVPTQALHVVGNICYTGGIGACSDVRYKKDFNPIGNALEKVLQMNGLTYYWKTEDFPENKFTTDKQIGFIAQDLEKIYPELVITDKNGYKSVDYAKLTPVLVEAIKEQQKIIESQQSSINTLKAENNNFKSQYESRLKALEDILGSASAKK